jgi:hypothetical protein
MNINMAVVINTLFAGLVMVLNPIYGYLAQTSWSLLHWNLGNLVW